MAPLPILLLLAAQQEPVLRVDVGLVNVAVAVENRDGEPRLGLGRADFRVFEDGIEQDIRNFSREQDLPLTLGVLIDLSTSQQPFWDKHKRTALRFLRRILRPGDEAFVVVFANRVKLVWDLTSSLEKLEGALTDLRANAREAPQLGAPSQGWGGTKFYDALTRSGRKLKSRPGRKAVVVLSDGEDQGSTDDVTDAIESLQGVDTLFYAFRTPSNMKRIAIRVTPTGIMRTDKSRMDRIARETGGRLFDGERVDLEKAFQQIEQELRSMYMLGYYPKRRNHDGGFRKIEVKLAQPELKARSRTGYFDQ